MDYVLFPIKLVFTIYALVLFIIFMLLVFPLVFAASFLGKVKGGNFIYSICRLWADIIIPFWGIRHKNIFESPHDTERQYIFVINHISYMDIPVILKAIRKQHFRVLGKYEISRIPIFGFIYKNTVIMVERNSAKKRAKSVLQLKSVLHKGISVAIFPEGTFNKTDRPLKEFYDGAFRIAIETKIPIKPVLFLDNYSRLNYNNFFSLTPGRSRAVFLDEINVDELTIKDALVLKEKAYKIMEEKLIAYSAAWIKSTDK